MKREMRKNCFSKKKIQHPPPPPNFFFYTNFFFFFFFNVGNSMKREENMKFWKKKFLKFYLFSIFKKFIFKQHSINIKNYTAHPHDLVHVSAKFRENKSMHFWVTVRKLNVTGRQTDRRTDRQTDGQTDGGRCNISRPGPSAPREIIKSKHVKTPGVDHVKTPGVDHVKTPGVDHVKTPGVDLPLMMTLTLL